MGVPVHDGQPCRASQTPCRVQCLCADESADPIWAQKYRISFIFWHVWFNVLYFDRGRWILPNNHRIFLLVWEDLHMSIDRQVEVRGCDHFRVATAGLGGIVERRVPLHLRRHGGQRVYDSSSHLHHGQPAGDPWRHTVLAGTMATPFGAFSWPDYGRSQ